MDGSPAEIDVNVVSSAEQDGVSGLVVDLGSLYDYLARLEDRRDPRGVRYRLVHILVFVLLAKLAGEDRLTAIAEWVWHRKEVLAQVEVDGKEIQIKAGPRDCCRLSTCGTRWSAAMPC